jgi:hypothetical protein
MSEETSGIIKNVWDELRKTIKVETYPLQINW